MFLKEFTYQPDSGLYVPPSGVPQFTYSDGVEIEDYILWAVSNATDKSSLSEELRTWIKDWPTRYHLSPSRANLLRPFSFLNNSVKVLEVGSGCGAITRYLGEMCGHVDAIEGSYRRAKITRERCSDLNNVNVYVSNVFEVSFAEEYDIATLIGVLEYAPTFSPKQVPKEECCAELLKRVTQALKDDGILILAIENKLGLKYWAGSREDHSCRLFDGLYDYPHFPGSPSRPVTFSKDELYQLLLAAGFRSVQFYYPFPDYKLPNTLIRDSEELKRGELFLHNWIVTPFEDYTGYREYLLHEGLTVKSLHKAGLLGELANSFLVLASRGNLSHLIDETWTAKRFSVERKPCYATVTTLYCKPALKVVKNRICSDISVPCGGPLSLTEKVEQWYPGDLLIYEFYKAVLDEEAPESRLKNLTNSLNDYLIKNYGTRLCDTQGYPLVYGRAFDVVSWNIIMSEERWVEIDREWEYQGMLPADFVLYRGLYYFLTSQQPYLARNNGIKIKEPDALIISLIRDVYTNYDEERHIKNKVWEGQLQDFVNALPFEVRIKQLQLQIEREQLEKQRVLNERDHLEAQVAEKEQRISELEQSFTDLSDRLSMREKKFLQEKDRLEAQVSEKERTIAHLEKSINELKKQLTEKDTELQLMCSSLGWSLIERYRKVADKIFPPGTKRRAIYELGQKVLKTFITAGPAELYKKTKNWFIIKSKQKNVKLKKVDINSEESIHASNGLHEEAYKHMLSMATTGRSKDYVPIQEHDLSPLDNPVRLIAFYLPQFHPIPENDEWWGKGFTEWTNVSKAVPQFIGHYQPHLPGELGFYDLRVPEVQRRQVELAKKYGIYGFCFYYYWFNGKRLLWRPIEQFISDSEIDFPFCLCWANENWTRRWDGLDNEILIAQVHSEENDFAFIKDIEPILRHKRYIRINGRPLLIVYRPQLMPNPAATAKRWKEYCRKAGIGDLYLVAAQTFGFYDPREVGFDAAVEFPPHNVQIPEINHTVKLLNPNFSGKIYRYTDVVECMSNRPRPPYQLFKTVFPSWDNEPRRPGRGHIFAFSSLDAYKLWLTRACLFALEDPDPEKRIVFINAWNEWAEGAHLEPDRRFGYAYLQATADVLRALAMSKKEKIMLEGKDASFSVLSSTVPGRWKILFVSHDAHVGGAQSVILDIVSWFKKHTFIDLKILCLNGGAWLERFKELGETLVLSELRRKTSSGEDLVKELRNFCGDSPDLIYANSVASGKEYHLLSRLNAPIITHVHELDMSIRRYAADCFEDVLRYSSHFIACSKAVEKNLTAKYGIDPAKITTVYSSINHDSIIQPVGETEKRKLRNKLRLEENKYVILGCGRGMPFRKGADLFIKVARALQRMGYKDFHFYWIGDFDENESDNRYGLWADHLTALKTDDLNKYVTFIGFKDNPKEYFQAGDIFLLTSREDPFPLVALEAAECDLPIVCFADAGGMSEFVEDDAGFVVTYEDVDSMAEKVALLMEDEELRRRLGTRAREKLLSKFTPKNSVPYILSTCRNVAQKKPVVSVIVPNYNHARYLPKRLDSIFGQIFKDYEVILLDDASTDNSMEILERYAHIADVRIVRNEQNSGSPFKQWLKGIKLARADIIWIAESDDACEPQFLETLIPVFQNPEVKLAYVDSYVINENDEVVGDYLNTEYLLSLSPTKWKKSYQVTATQEINDGLGVKNTILNISAVLFRKFEINEEFQRILEGMRIAGDWYLIVHAIKDGKVHYEAQKLNYHRRHPESIISKTISEKRIGDFFREFYTVQKSILENYEISSDFYDKLDRHLRKQWDDFFPGRPFEEMSNYYPLEQVRNRLLKA